MVYGGLDQFPEAVAAFQQAIRLAPKIANYYYQLGVTYVDMGRKEDALAIAETLKRLDPPRAAELSSEVSTSFVDRSQPGMKDDPEDNLLLGQGRFADSAYRYALRAFRRVIVLKPSPDTLAEAHHWIGLVYEEQKQYKKAAAEYQGAIRLNPRDPHNHFRLGLMYLALGQQGQALAVLRTLQALDKATAEKLTAEINKARPAPETPHPSLRETLADRGWLIPALLPRRNGDRCPV